MYLAVRLLVAWGVNILALMVADWVFSGFTLARWGPLLLAGAVFGLANVFLKPLLTFIAIPLIILTFGIAYFFVNVAILAFTEWVVPDFSIDGFWTYVGAVIVMWLVNIALGRLLRAVEGDEALAYGVSSHDEHRLTSHSAIPVPHSISDHVADARPARRGEQRMRRLAVVLLAVLVAVAMSTSARGASAVSYGIQDDAWLQFGPGDCRPARRHAEASRAPGRARDGALGSG